MSSKKPPFRVRFDILLYRLTRNWKKVILTLIGFYAFLPLMAPIMMNLGLQGPASILYTVYSPFCHQFAFRSFFIGGDQPVYPRSAADTNWVPYEDYVEDLPEFRAVQDPYEFMVPLQLTSRAFVGNEEMGYKTTLCERDLAIYIALFTGGVLYAFVGRRIRPVPMLLFIFLGLGPIGLDGFSQLLSYPPFEFWEVRETIPLYRVMTGALFGLMGAWLGFPYIDRAMEDTLVQLKSRLARNGVSAEKL